MDFPSRSEFGSTSQVGEVSNESFSGLRPVLTTWPGRSEFGSTSQVEVSLGRLLR